MSTDDRKPEREDEQAAKQGHVEDLARKGVDKALAQEKAERRGFTITKFGRHDDGYLHSRVTINGTGYYVHRRYGSWMAPGTISGRSVLMEIDALIGGNAIEIKEALQQKARTLERAERRDNGEPDEHDLDPDANGEAIPGGVRTTGD